MVVLYFFIFCIFLNIYIIKTHVILTKLNDTNKEPRFHLSFAHVQRVCQNRHIICKLNHTNVCAVRYINDNYEYKHFENSCFLYMSNMCDNPDAEFSIAQSGLCPSNITFRRSEDDEPNTEIVTGTNTETDADVETTTDANTYVEQGNTTKPALRESSFSTLYATEQAFDGHICPYSCPKIYSPVCINANKGIGKFFKFWTFISHCAGDLYYCKHEEEFAPPPDDDYEESVQGSQLAWSFCAASRYTQFVKFAESASSMSHYGWLEGNERHTKIMHPSRVKPGFG